VDGLLVRPEDQEAVAEGVGRLLDDSDLSKRLAETGRRSAERYSWDSVGGEIEAVYREVVQRARAR
jgi:glycosyltransferase involved in cell wall biosynthesis